MTLDGPTREAETAAVSRRRVVAATGATGLVAGLLGLLAALFRSTVPEVLYEPPRRFPVGKPADFAPGATLVSEHRLFVFRTADGFFCVSAVCTHLGCNVNHQEGRGFACPCHGSAFGEDGAVLQGPAAWPLPRFAISLSRHGELVVDTRHAVGPEFRLKA